LYLGEWNSQLHRRNPPTRVKDSVRVRRRRSRRVGGLCLYRRDSVAERVSVHFQSPGINWCFKLKNAHSMEDGDKTTSFSDSDQSDILNWSSIPQAPEGFKSGFIGIIGRPNVGKSTLMNQLVGQKIAITSPVAQTTRNRLRGILTTPQAQMIFVDTPGIHKPHHQLGKVLVQNARTAIDSVDVVVFVVDGTVEAGGGDRFIVELLTHTQTPVILGINKSDLQPPQDISSLPNQEELRESIDASYAELATPQNWTVTKFSALTGDGLDTLQQLLIDRLEPGPYYYPPDLVTDQPERFIMGELIREQILLQTREEVPHSVAITIDVVEEEPKITRILSTIHVERDSQKGILIGKGGSMLKKIGSAAREQMQKLIAGKVYLELFVKVVPKWRQSRIQLAEFGYQIED
jgi:GTP-binding protein Era